MKQTFNKWNFVWPKNNKSNKHLLHWDHRQNMLTINMEHIKANNNLIGYIWDQDPKYHWNMSY